MKVETMSPRQMTEIWNEENQPISPYNAYYGEVKIFKVGVISNCVNHMENISKNYMDFWHDFSLVSIHTSLYSLWETWMSQNQ